MRMRRGVVGLLAVAGCAVGAMTTPASAGHAWGGYHWQQPAGRVVTVPLGDNLSSTWKPHLQIAALGTTVSSQSFPGWASSAVLDTPVEAGGTSPKNCRPTRGRVEVCNASYGRTGWLGLAQIWTSEGHIVQGTAKQNDTYFAKPPYNTPAWRQSVLCQEVGHTFGLGHVDEDHGNANTGSCMDYTSDPDGTLKGQLSNEYPNQHDLDTLDVIYNEHDTSVATSSGSTVAPRDHVGNDPGSWGRLVRGEDRETTSLFVREHSNGAKVFTFVVWAH